MCVYWSFAQRKDFPRRVIPCHAQYMCPRFFFNKTVHYIITYIVSHQQSCNYSYLTYLWFRLLEPQTLMQRQIQERYLSKKDQSCLSHRHGGMSSLMKILLFLWMCITQSSKQLCLVCCIFIYGTNNWFCIAYWNEVTHDIWVLIE